MFVVMDAYFLLTLHIIYSNIKHITSSNENYIIKQGI